jgi:hypothetical protein
MFYVTIAGYDSYQVVVSEDAFTSAASPSIPDSSLKPYATSKTALRYDTSWPGISQINQTLSSLHKRIDGAKWDNLTWLKCFDSITLTENYSKQRHVVMFTDYRADEDNSIIGLATLSGVNYGTQRPVAICPEEYLMSTTNFKNTSPHPLMPRTSKIKKDGKKVGSSMCWPYWNGTTAKLKKDNLNSERFSGYDPASDIQLKYCLRENIEPQCAIYYSPLITMIVAGVTGLQALLMTVVLISTHHTPLVLPGDVIESYLKHPDVYTAPPTDPDQCHSRDYGSVGFNIAWWVVSIFLVVQLVVLISWGSTAMDWPGLLRADSYPKTWFIAPICITGAVQLVLVVREYLENVIATIESASAEFNRLAHRRMPLRVSYPRPAHENQQKAAYILQLPVGLAVWHIGTSAFIHWWVSLYFSVQLFMVVRLDGRPDYPELSARPNSILVMCFGTVFTWFKKIFTGAFSGVRGGSGSEFLAILFLVIVVPFTIALFVIFAGPLFLHGLSVIPLLYRGGGTDGPIGDGTNSLEISLACHPPADEGDISEKSLKWGYVESQENNGLFILTLSSRHVTPVGGGNPTPREQQSYAQYADQAGSQTDPVDETASVSTTGAVQSASQSFDLSHATPRDQGGPSQTSRASLHESTRRSVEERSLLDERRVRSGRCIDDDREDLTDFGAYRHLL